MAYAGRPCIRSDGANAVTVKNKRLPSVQRIPKDDPQDGKEEERLHSEPQKESEVPTPAPEVRFANLDVPMGELASGAYVPRFERMEFRSMSLVQARSLKRLTRGLEDSGETLSNGTRVSRPGQAIRWLLEQLDQPE